MYVFGGYEENYERFGQDVYRLDLNTYTWKLMVFLDLFSYMKVNFPFFRHVTEILLYTEIFTQPQLLGTSWLFMVEDLATRHTILELTGTVTR